MKIVLLIFLLVPFATHAQDSQKPQRKPAKSLISPGSSPQGSKPEPKEIEITVQIGDDQFFSNVEGGTTFRTQSGRIIKQVLRDIGVSPYLLKPSRPKSRSDYPISNLKQLASVSIARENEDPKRTSTGHTVADGDTLHVHLVDPIEELSAADLKSRIVVCESTDGPYWPMNLIDTFVPHAHGTGLEQGFVSPGGLPWVSVDWAKASVRVWRAGGWKETPLLELKAMTKPESGTMFVLPRKTGTKSSSAPDALHKLIQERFSFSYRMAIGENTPMETRKYVPPAFNAILKNGRWIWRDAGSESPRPSLPTRHCLAADRIEDPRMIFGQLEFVDDDGFRHSGGKKSVLFR